MNGAAGGNLQNVLSISTAANNRYLLHFNSLSSLTQWTAGIRLAMYEHATLQEAYTGSLIAGKGKYLNNIKAIMERSKFQHDDWARVRFGAGTPWKRCWCVVSPPDEKAFAKAQKDMKKSSAYERIKMPKGDIKFYDTRKVTKKTRPIATITDAYAAYAIYPQSKPLIDQSTLVKLEGLVTIYDSQEQTTEGFVFVMPEVHAAVSGFEMMLRWLFPVWDTFALYGRPTRLIADTLDQRGLMFAMPRDRRYGYLDILDVSGMIHTKGSVEWTERQWRREMKKMTSERMNNQVDGSPQASRHSSQRRATTSRTSLPPSRGGVRFGEDYAQSQPGSRSASPGPIIQDGQNSIVPPKRTDSAPPGAGHMSPHKRSVSEAQGYRKYLTETPSRLSEESSRPGERAPPPPPKHGGPLGATMKQDRVGRSHGPGSLQRIESESVVPTVESTQNEMQMQTASPHLAPPEPVGTPPAFTHQANSRPVNQPYAAPELRRAHSNVDVETLYQMQDAVRRERTPETPDGQGQWNGDVQQRQQNTVASYTATRNLGVPADRSQGAVDRQSDPGQRLSTIPGSPYVGAEAQNLAATQAGPVNGMARVREERSRSGDRRAPESPMHTPPIALHSQKSLLRKPVPKRQDTSPTPTPPVPTERTLSNVSADSPSPVAESWAGGYIDDDALERVLGGSRSNTMQTTESSEPDYASTISASTKGKKSIERPRAGKLKTVGDPEMPTIDPRSGGAGRLDTYAKEQADATAEIPGVDFGPTLQYKPTSRPGTSGTLMPDLSDKRRSQSADALRSRSKDRLSGVFNATPKGSPHESNRNSYFGGRTTPSPGRGLTPEPAGRLTPDAFGRLSPSGSPGAAHVARRSVTPEEWVAQRANMAQQPQYAPPRKPVHNLAHMRSESTNSVKQRKRLTKTPPLGRTLSGDWTNFGGAGRETPPPRPSSRGAGVNLDLASASLTAREQMQVSRATGTPLVDLAQTKKPKPREDDHGLVGAVAARERDKAASRSNRNSIAVQQAIVERQQQQMRAEAEAQAHAQAQAQHQYQMQVQAAHQQQVQAMQQQMYYGQQPQQQQAGYAQSPGPQQQRPGAPTWNSWFGGSSQGPQQQFQPPPQGYYAASPVAYSPGGFAGQQQPQSLSPSQPQQPFAPQPYGASFYAQQQQQQQGGQRQGQGQGKPGWRTWR